MTLVRDAGGEATHLSQWAGLGRRSPLVAGVFAFFLLAFAGIPLTSGFTGKFAVFKAAVGGWRGAAGHRRRARQRDRGVLLRAGDRADVLLRARRPTVPTVVVPSVFTTAAIAVGVWSPSLLGVVPQPLLDLADRRVGVHPLGACTGEAERPVRGQHRRTLDLEAALADVASTAGGVRC